jgi:hypothetical protein
MTIFPVMPSFLYHSSGIAFSTIAFLYVIPNLSVTNLSTSVPKGLLEIYL